MTNEKIKYYTKLARLHRPHGTLLMLLPSWWGIALAYPKLPPLSLLLLFLVGALLMRSAGCVYNDMIDKDFDKGVKRTSSRPIAAGNISLREAFVFFILLLTGAAGVLFNLPPLAIGIGFITLVLVLLYPWMKQITYWPQLFLGVTFNMGLFIGWFSVTSTFSFVPLLFYGGAILWTLGYDTIYGLQDIEDDLRVGVKSSSIKVFSQVRSFLVWVYGGTLVLWGVGGKASNLNWGYWIFFWLIAVHFLWQVFTLQKENPTNCLKRFESNSIIGAMLFLGIVFSRLID